MKAGKQSFQAFQFQFQSLLSIVLVLSFHFYSIFFDFESFMMFLLCGTTTVVTTTSEAKMKKHEIPLLFDVGGSKHATTRRHESEMEKKRKFLKTKCENE